MRRRLYLLITLLVPVLFFLVLELVLRAFDFGPSLDLFVTEEIGGRQYYVMNPDVAGRYFSQVHFSPNTSLDYFQVPKPPLTYRVFSLGGSTTIGFPYGQVGSFSTFLRERLQRVFPSKRIEVINLGMTATNSYTVNDIAAELGPYEPDLLVVYDGHNEFYGALGASSVESPVRSRWATKLYLRLIHLKTFQALKALLGTLTGSPNGPPSPDGPAGTLMEMLARDQHVPIGSDMYASALETFRANLSELASIGQDLQIPVILCTQVSNLRDQAPFVSDFSQGTTSSDRERVNAWKSEGAEKWRQSRLTEAAELFRKALALDSTRADLNFALAKCLDTLGNRVQAYRFYVRARDTDHLRFRASSDFNRVILDAGTQSGIFAADVEHEFRHISPDSLIGYSLMLEHLHPNLRGHFIIARAVADHLRRFGLVGSADEWEPADTLDEEALWASHPISEIDRMAAGRRIQLLTSGWPFRTQAPSQEPTVSDSRIEEIVNELVEGRITWEQSHVAAAEHYHRQRRLDAAAREYMVLIRQFPTSVSAYLRLAQIYIAQNRFPDAKRTLLASLDIESTPYAYTRLGTIALDEGTIGDAVNFLQQAYELSAEPNERLNAAYFLAVALYRNGQGRKALSPLREALRIRPDFAQGQQLLRELESRN